MSFWNLFPIRISGYALAAFLVFAALLVAIGDPQGFVSHLGLMAVVLAGGAVLALVLGAIVFVPTFIVAALFGRGKFREAASTGLRAAGVAVRIVTEFAATLASG